MATDLKHKTHRNGSAEKIARKPVDADFALPAEGLSPQKRKQALSGLNDYFAQRKAEFLGYQTNQDLTERPELATFLNYHSNNVGDPFQDSDFTLHTRPLEREVLKYYAKLWNATLRNDDDPAAMPKDAYWGYVLTMGSSEGNVYALWNARDYLSGKTLMSEENRGAVKQMWVQDTPPASNLNAFSPVAFYSQDTHYSVAKAMRVLGIANFYEVGTNRYPHANPLAPGQEWPHEVPSVGGSEGPGCVDVDKLLALVEFFAKMGHPVLINLNYGSTFKGAYDDVETICARLEPIFKKYGLDQRPVRFGRDKDGKDLIEPRAGYWVHVDGALAATYAPFLAKAIADKKISEKDAQNQEIRLPKFDFRIPQVSSIVTSGHKYPGAPWACGVFMTKRNLQMSPPPKPDVIGSPDTTFGGSRNAFSPVVMWDFLARHSESKQIDMIVEAEKVAAYAQQKLTALGANLLVERTPWSLSVRFKKPSSKIVHEFSLATVPLKRGNQVIEFAHLYVMPHVTRELVDKLVAALAQEARSVSAKPKAVPVDKSLVHGTAEHDDVLQLAYVPMGGRRGF